MGNGRKGGINTRRRRGLKSKLWARDYSCYEGRWGNHETPHLGHREVGNVRWIRCCYCAQYVIVSQADIAHVVPRCRGGADHIDNLMLAHHTCNQLEGRAYDERPQGLEGTDDAAKRREG